MREEFFTIGGVLARVWRPAYPLLPWVLTSALLTVAALWGRWNDGAPVEWVVLGLAAYELMMGLLSIEDAAHEAQQQTYVTSVSSNRRLRV